ncbi:MAG: thioredoxin family protein [Candidatus Methanomethylophilaceae archaeon]
MFRKKSESGSKDAYVKILGMNGCKKCKMMTDNAADAVSRTGLDYTVAHVTDMKTVSSYGVMQTPALVIGERVVSVGKVLTTDEIIDILKKETQK